MADTRSLQETWIELYSKTLPSLARARDIAQPTWPVTLDHCFARIILDNTVGEGREQWDKRLKRPAVRNMSHEQLVKAIILAERIRDGKEDLVALDLQSLEVRGKVQRKYKGKSAELNAEDRKQSQSSRHLEEDVPKQSTTKRKPAEQDHGNTAAQSFKKSKLVCKQSTLSFVSTPIPQQITGPDSPPASDEDKIDLMETLDKIRSHPGLTPYRRRLYTALLSVPRGHYTTYAALSDYLGSSARAVGSGMRNNPFAPEVPCHRVLASDGSIGGFGGSWGIDGKNAGKKVELLRKEGVRFDSNGKVRSPQFKNFGSLLGAG
jgi:O-6-methylguanine DNA methyltransferase